MPDDSPERTTCDDCGISCARSRDLKRHLKYSCPYRSETPRFDCTLCGQLFHREDTARRHYGNRSCLERLFNSLDYKCRVCEAVFETKERLTEHQAHPELNERMLNCTMCGEVGVGSSCGQVLQHQGSLRCLERFFGTLDDASLAMLLPFEPNVGVAAAAATATATDYGNHQ